MAKQLGKEGKAGDQDKERQQEIGGNLTQETFLQSCQEMAAINAKVAAANEERRKVRKTIKARGIELGILDATLKMADWDREEVRLAFDNRRRYAEWLGLPIGTQTDMFKDLTPEQKAQQEAHARGVTDARAGKSGQPPEDLAEEHQEAYVRGFKGKTLEPKKKGPRTNGEGKIVAPEPDPEMEKEFEAGANKVPADSEAALQ